MAKARNGKISIKLELEIERLPQSNHYYVLINRKNSKTKYSCVYDPLGITFLPDSILKRLRPAVAKGVRVADQENREATFNYISDHLVNAIQDAILFLSREAE